MQILVYLFSMNVHQILELLQSYMHLHFKVAMQAYEKKKENTISETIQKWI